MSISVAIILIVPFILAIIAANQIMPLIYFVSYKKRFFDEVDVRKKHVGIIPRLGGLAFVPIQCCLMTITIVLMHKYNLLNDLHLNSFTILPMFSLFIVGLVILFLLGVSDDLVGTNYKAKFIVQLFVASLLPLSGLWINDLYGVGFIVALSPWVGIPLTIFLIILIINAINLIDGLDGLCSGLIIVATFFLGILFAFEGVYLHATFSFITAGVLLPFFYYNVFGRSKRRRRIFMGDTGSLTLGYTISFLAISYAMNNQTIQPFSEGAIVVAYTTLFIPVMDVARVMIIRFRLGKPLFQPDRNHIHHLLLDMGMSHRRVMILILAVSIFFCIFNLAGVNMISNNIVLMADLLIWSGLHIVIHRLRNRKMQQRVTLTALNKTEKLQEENKKSPVNGSLINN